MSCVASGVVGAANQPAVAALLDVPSERRRSADLDRGHDTSLDPAETSAMAATERFAVAAEDIRHLRRGTHRPVSGPRCHLEAQSVEWAWSTANGAGRDLGVTRRGGHVAMAEQRLDDADIGGTLQQVGGEAVPQRM
jgi:hypothetical protein